MDIPGLNVKSTKTLDKIINLFRGGKNETDKSNVGKMQLQEEVEIG